MDAGASETVILTVPVFMTLPCVAVTVIVDSPAATPVTVPELLTVATDVLLEE